MLQRVRNCKFFIRAPCKNETVMWSPVLLYPPFLLKSKPKTAPEKTLPTNHLLQTNSRCWDTHIQHVAPPYSSITPSSRNLLLYPPPPPLTGPIFKPSNENKDEGSRSRGVQKALVKRKKIKESSRNKFDIRPMQT